MAANFGDARIGYEYYINTHGSASFEEINDYLLKNEHNPISKRTFNHYRSLMRYGYRSYFPINQFDVSRMLGQLPVAPDRRRYEREKVNIDANISTDGIIWIQSKVIDKSIVGFGLITSEKLSIKNGYPIWVRIPRYNAIPAILVWHKIQNNITRFGVRAVEFISVYGISQQKKPIKDLTGFLIVKKTSEEGLSWNELYNLIGKIEKLFDASSELLKYVAEQNNIKLDLLSPILSSIKFSSPGEVSVIIDWKFFALLVVLIRIVQLWRIDKNRLKEANRTLKLNNDMREMQIEYARKLIKTRKVANLDIAKQLLSALPDLLKKVFNIDKLTPDLFESGSLINQMSTEQLLPAAADLIGGDDQQIEVDLKESSSDENDNENPKK
jgi:hypothetical protein